MLKELKDTCHSWEVGLGGVARPKGKSPLLGGLQSPVQELDVTASKR